MVSLRVPAVQCALTSGRDAALRVTSRSSGRSRAMSFRRIPHARVAPEMHSFALVFVSCTKLVHKSSRNWLSGTRRYRGARRSPRALETVHMSDVKA